MPTKKKKTENDTASTSHHGRITQVLGAVVDVEFPEGTYRPRCTHHDPPGNQRMLYICIYIWREYIYGERERERESKNFICMHVCYTYVYIYIIF
jgi:hypothetical protein